MTKNTFDADHLEPAPDKLYQAIAWIMASIALLIFIFFMIGQYGILHPTFYNPRCETYDGPWTHTDINGFTDTDTAPVAFYVVGQEEIRVSTVLPDEIPDEYYLFYKTGKNIRVEVDGEPREDYPIGHSEFGVNVKSLWLPIKLYPSDAGKTLTLIRTDVGEDTLLVSSAYIGNIFGFIQELLMDNMLILLLAFSILVFDALVVVLCIFFRIRSKKSFALMYLSIAVYVAALWLLFDNLTYPFLFNNYYIDGISEFLLVILLPYPFMAYLNILQKRRYQKIYNVASLELLLVFFVFSFLQFTEILDFNTALPLINLNTGVAVVFTVGVLLYDLLKVKNRDYLIGGLGFLAFIPMAVAEVLHVSVPGHTNDGFYIAIGLILLLMLSIYQEVVRIRRMREETTQAQASSAAKSVFLANMSHEIRTPINAILGMNEMILREDISDPVREYAESVRDASNALLDIINDILDFSKVEQGKLELMPEEYDIGELLNSVINMIRVKSNEKCLELITNVSEQIPRKLYGDPKRIREILINLMNNAVKYTPQGSITLNVTMDTVAQPPFLTVSVKDTGIGIREEDQDKLFKQFERLDYNKNRNIEGTGLGLAIAASYVRLMGGSIICKSEYGKGTEFVTVIPQEIRDDTPVGNIGKITSSEDKKANRMDTFTCPKAKLLVVDDNLINQKVAVHLLQISQAQVECCSSGPEMLDLICQEKYDIIFLDHMMPDMDGIEALERSRELEDNLNQLTPYIALTANAIVGAKELYLEHGFTDYLSKPISTADLAEVLLTYLPADKIRKK